MLHYTTYRVVESTHQENLTYSLCMNPSRFTMVSIVLHSTTHRVVESTHQETQQFPLHESVPIIITIHHVIDNAALYYYLYIEWLNLHIKKLKQIPLHENILIIITTHHGIENVALYYI